MTKFGLFAKTLRSASPALLVRNSLLLRTNSSATCGILCGGWTCSVPQSSEILMFSQVALLACVRGVVLQRLKKHVEAKGTCQGSEQRDRSLQSLSWREKWQWATTAERKVFRDMLGLTKAEACRLTKGLTAPCSHWWQAQLWEC